VAVVDPLAGEVVHGEAWGVMGGANGHDIQQHDVTGV
jgi:hypothetical protein